MQNLPARVGANLTGEYERRSDAIAAPMNRENVPMALPKRVLISNRGEIAIRIAKGRLRSLGCRFPSASLRSADALGLHTTFTTELVALGGDISGSVDAYLDAEALVRAAKTSGCDSVHPGYGFLAESGGLRGTVPVRGLDFCRSPSGGA